MLLEVRRLPGDVRKLVEPVDGLRSLAHLLSGEADHATDGRPSRRPWRDRRSDDQAPAIARRAAAIASSAAALVPESRSSALNTTPARRLGLSQTAGPGPALERLRRTFTNRASYHRLERAPAVHDPSNRTPEVEAYRDYDLVDEPPLLRSGASLDAAGLTGHARRQRPSRPRVAAGPTAGAAARLVASSASRRAYTPTSSWPPPATKCASTTTRSSKAPITTRSCSATEARPRSPRAADGAASAPDQRGRAGRTVSRFPLNAWSQTRLLRQVPANAEAEQVPQAHDPNQRRPRNDGKMTEPAAEHDLGRPLRVDMRPHGLRVACHPPGHG